jgi:hypothetical protein
MMVKKATVSPCEALKWTCAARFALSSSTGGPFRFGTWICAFVAGACVATFLRAPVISDAGVKISPFSMVKLGELGWNFKE